MKNVILTQNAPAPIGPYSQAVEVKGLVFFSGQIPLDPVSGTVVGEGDVEAQTRQVMKNVSAMLQAAQVSFNDVIKTTIFLKSMDDFPKVNAIYGESFTAQYYPARSTVEVARLPKNVLVEIEVIAQKAN